MKSNGKIHIATVGRCVGLFGDLKLHLYTDFCEQFEKGRSFTTQNDKELVISSYDPKRSLIRFEGYAAREAAAALVNTELYSTVEKSMSECTLKEGEYFWFEITGAKVEEDGMILGVVEEIQRIANIDYLVVRSDKSLIDKDMADRFYIPYIPAYIDRFEKEIRTVYTKNAYDLLEAS